MGNCGNTHNVLNRIVTTCVMNWLGGHWLLSNCLNALIMSISFTLTLEVEMGHAIDVINVLHFFDAKVLVFQNNMRAEVVKVINLFHNF